MEGIESLFHCAVTHTELYIFNTLSLYSKGLELYIKRALVQNMITTSAVVQFKLFVSGLDQPLFFSLLLLILLFLLK